MELNTQQPPIQNVSPPASPKELLLRGRLKWGLIAIIVALLSSGTTYLIVQSQQQQTPPPQVNQTHPTTTATTGPTANWETYVSEDKTYLFQYPKNQGWEVYNGNGLISVTCKLCKPQVNKDNISYYYIHTPAVSYKSLDDYVANHLKNISVTEYHKENIFGSEALKTFYPGSRQAGGPAVIIFLFHNGQAYEIEYRYVLLMDRKGLNDLPPPDPDILQTFKFLN